jgi:hypothetical protein
MAQAGGGAATGPPRGAVSPGLELNVIADFPSPYGSLGNEVGLIAAGRWEPSTDDFLAVAGRGAITCDHFQNLLATILFAPRGTLRPPRTIRRVNIFTHANSGLIAFRGEIHPLTMGPPEIILLGEGALNSAALAVINAPTFNFTVPAFSRRTFNLADVRARFVSPDAQVFLYACHSAVDQVLLADLANTLQATVIGFSGLIAYCPTFTTTPPAITFGIGVNNCANAVTNFHDLAGSNPNNVVTRRPSPSP